jgi:hypothetical protein
MSLSYSLDISNLQNLDKLSKALISLGTIGPETFLFRGVGSQRFYQPSVITKVQDIFPTGEYIIRDGMYINGIFVYVGSYKAYFKDLFGAGSNGYAWDGFIMAMRGYSINDNEGLVQRVSNGPFEGEYTGGTGFGFLPMRMPIEVNCGVSGDSAQIAADSSVGLHSLDVFKRATDVTVTNNDLDIRIITCGFQRVNPLVESVPTGMDYVANLYLGTLFSFNGEAEIQNGEKVADYEYAPANMMQVTWQASQAGHADKTTGAGRFGMLRDLDQVISASQSITTFEYTFAEWLNLQKPDGTGGDAPTGNDTRAITFNYFPRRFFDISCFSNTKYNYGGDTAKSPFFIVGDMALDTNDDGSIDDTCPVMIGCAYPFSIFGTPIATLGPFMNSCPAIATSLANDPSWYKEDTAVAYNFSGAWACSILVPYEDLGVTGDFSPLSYIAVNDVTHSGSTYGEIYSFIDSPLSPSSIMVPFAVETGNFTTTTGISLPTRWYNKAVQFRTFTTEEEDNGKAGKIDLNTGAFTPSLSSLYDSDSQEYIGFSGNYQRYGSYTNPLAPNQPQGTRSGAGYGFLGFKTGTGPIAIMFDSGGGAENVNGATGAFEGWTGITLAEGGNINNNHIENPTSATRKIVNCGWDNDRDQWLFLTSDTNDVGIISASSDFSTASNNVGFLDQKDNFLGLNTNTNAGAYFPLTMSNAMDGWVWFGTLDTDTTVRFGIKQTSLGTAESRTVGSITYDTYPDATTEARRITGTTGRTAKVWVDYVLFDGVDSVIATKLKGLGMKVNIESVEWFKRSIIRSGDLNIKSEEIEEWMREQQSQYKEMLKETERQGRVRKRKSQVSVYREGMDDQINPEFMDTEVKDYIDTFIPKERPPSPTEKKLEKKRKGGYEPKQSSYYDEVFEDEP